MFKGGIVKGRLPAACSKEMWRYVDMRGAPSYLLPTTRLMTDKRERSFNELDLVFRRLARSVRFAPVLQFASASCDHITGAKFLAAGDRRRSQRFIVGVDSDATRGAFSNGRSSSRRLNNMLRSAAPPLIGAGICLGVFRVPSEGNVADGLTRNAPLLPSVCLRPSALPWTASSTRPRGRSAIACSRGEEGAKDE